MQIPSAFDLGILRGNPIIMVKLENGAILIKLARRDLS